jgi:hypothetical protein
MMKSQVIQSQSRKSHLIGGGAIACSTLLVYGWAQAAAPSQNPKCQPQKPSGSGAVRSCAPSTVQPESPSILGVAPAQLLEHLPAPLLGLWNAESAPGNHLPQTMEAMYEQLLTQAQSSAGQSQFTQAIAQVAGIPKNSRHYELANRLQQDWSQELLRQANQHYDDAKLDAAQAVLAKIPANSSFHAQAVSLKQQWQQQQTALKRAIAAKQQGDWQGVIDALEPLESTPLHQSLRVQELWQQAITRLYEPDQSLVYVAMADVPVERPSMAPPEAIANVTTLQ